MKLRELENKSYRIVKAIKVSVNPLKVIVIIEDNEDQITIELNQTQSKRFIKSYKKYESRWFGDYLAKDEMIATLITIHDNKFTLSDYEFRCRYN